MLTLAAFLCFTGSASALLCTPFLGCTCTVTASDIDFDDFTPFAGTQDAEGQIDVHCDNVIDVAPSVVVRVQQGQWGTIASRKMRASGGYLLDYNLYTTAQRNVIWGDGTGGSSTASVSGGLITLGNWSAHRTIFGRASPTSTTRPGDYADRVVVRIDW
jgi:spore coat protein U-like protein